MYYWTAVLYDNGNDCEYYVYKGLNSNIYGRIDCKENIFNPYIIDCLIPDRVKKHGGRYSTLGDAKKWIEEYIDDYEYYVNGKANTKKNVKKRKDNQNDSY